MNIIISNIGISNISSKESLKAIVQEYARVSDAIQYKFSKNINITKHFKVWWNKKCNKKLIKYRSSKMTKNWKNFKEVIKKTKYIFFNNRIQEIVSKNKRHWGLMNWIKRQKMPAIEALQYINK